MKNYKHFIGPHYPICQFPGTEVLDPFQGNKITEEEAIEILISRDPRRNSRSCRLRRHIKDCSEAYRLKYRK
jgi:hypothetical protein